MNGTGSQDRIVVSLPAVVIFTRNVISHESAFLTDHIDVTAMT